MAHALMSSRHEEGCGPAGRWGPIAPASPAAEGSSIGRADLERAGQKEDSMQRMSVLLAVILLAATFLGGCVVVPVGERWHGEGRYEREDGGEGHYHYHASQYRPYEHGDR